MHERENLPRRISSSASTIYDEIRRTLIESLSIGSLRILSKDLFPVKGIFLSCFKLNEEDLESVAPKVFDAIFQDKDSVEIDGEVYEMERTSRSKLRKFAIRGFTFLEQNPNKDSHWAEKARDGHEIMWVLKGRKYVARVMDGKYLKLK